MYGGTPAPNRSDANTKWGLSPRVRGNHPRCNVGTPGLSPRVRGNPRKDFNLQSAGKRSIPACTGEPLSQRPSRQPTARVYPRVYGGTSDARLTESIPAAGLSPSEMAGLSPRVRGNLTLCTVVRRRLRVYPRVYGGTVPIDRLYGAAGSIPACTGEPFIETHCKWTNWIMRSIPACTGEPIGPAFSRNRGCRSIPACTGEPADNANVAACTCCLLR